MKLPFLGDDRIIGKVFDETRLSPESVRAEIEALSRVTVAPMSVRERQQLLSRHAVLRKQLQVVGYDDRLAELEEIRGLYRGGLEVVTVPSSGERLERRALAARGRRLQEELQRCAVWLRERDDIADQLESDERRLEAVLGKKAQRKIALDNAHAWAKIIIGTWTALGYCRDKKGHQKSNFVRFERIEITPSYVYYKILVSDSGLFGRKRVLPEGVRVMAQLLSDSTIAELSAACQRVVEARPTSNNGSWLRVSMVDTAGALPSHVTLKSLVKYFDGQEREMLPLPLGVSAGNNLEFLYLSSSNHAHLLVAGSTGAAKSNFLNNILCSLLLQFSPAELQFVLVDLKEGGVEFQPYRAIPHLLSPLVTAVEAVPDLFGRLEVLMKDRGSLFNDVGVRNIVEYNGKVSPEKRLSHVVMLFDEFASIMQPRKRKLGHMIHDLTVQLLAKGRSFGVHVVLCTQYPSVDVVASIGKANLATRISGYFPQKANSLAVFDSGVAAELAQVPGRMAALVDGVIIQVQTPHVPLEYVLEVVAGLPPGAAAPGVQALALVPVAVQDGDVDEVAYRLLLSSANKLRVARLVRDQRAGSLSIRALFELLKGEFKLADVQALVDAIIIDGVIVVDGVEIPVIQRGGSGKYVLDFSAGVQVDLSR